MRFSGSAIVLSLPRGIRTLNVTAPADTLKLIDQLKSFRYAMRGRIRATGRQTLENMWSPDRTQWWLIWIGFLTCSLVAVDNARGLAAFLFGVFGLLIYYRE